MMRVIFSCMAIVILSFILTPIYFGVSAERDIILKKSTKQENKNNTLSFKQIYKIINQSEFEQGFDPAPLNKITPFREKDEGFSLKFSATKIPALPEANSKMKTDLDI